MHCHLGHDGALMHCEAHNLKADYMIRCMPANTERCCRQIAWVSLMHQPQGRSAEHPSCGLDHAGGCLSLLGHTNLLGARDSNFSDQKSMKHVVQQAWEPELQVQCSWSE